MHETCACSVAVFHGGLDPDHQRSLPVYWKARLRILRFGGSNLLCMKQNYSNNSQVKNPSVEMD